MLYLIQENTFKEPNYDNLIDALERMDIEYVTVKCPPFIDELWTMNNEPYIAPTTHVFLFGSMKMARISKDRGWYPGSLMNNNHDYEVYSKYYKDHLLNYDSEIKQFNDPTNWNSPRFVRPCEDTKTFTGKVFPEPQWNEFVKYSLTNGHNTSLTEFTRIQISIPKTIYKEWRFWIIDGKIAGASLYRSGNIIASSDIVDQDAIDFCNKMIKIYCLAEAFIIDICSTDHGMKIVECGCINCAGFYAVNMGKLIEAIENKFN